MQTALRLFFRLLYHPFAWAYDFVAWTVSAGQWQSWGNSALPFVSGPRVLELGFGPGHLQVRLFKQGFSPAGLDASPTMAKIASKRILSHLFSPELVQGQAEAIPFSAQSFDTLLATFPSKYIVESKALAEMRRVLSPAGRLIIVPMAWITGSQLHQQFAARLFQITGQTRTWEEHFSNTLTKNGFDVETHWLELPASRVVVLIAHKRPDFE